MPSRRRFVAVLGAAILAGCGSPHRVDDDPEPRGRVRRERDPETVQTPETTEPAPPSTEETDPPASVDAIEEEVVDIRDHGAEIDGSADSATAIQSAIHAAEEGDTVFIPPGRVLVATDGVERSSALELRGDDIADNLTVSGAGRNSVIEIADDQEMNHIGVTLTGSESFGGLELRDFRIDGNKASQGERGGHGIRVSNPNGLSNAADVRMRNLWVENCNQTGISLRRGGIYIDCCSVRNCAKHGISIGETGDRHANPAPVVIRRTLCEGNGKGGSSVTYGINCSGGNVQVVDSVCHNNAQGTKTTEDSINITYRRVRLEGNKYHGYIRAGEETDNRSRVIFDNVVARNNGESGFRLSRSTDYVIPSRILARENGSSNIVIRNDASIEAEEVWSNLANNSYGVVSDSVVGGYIQKYYSFNNGGGALDSNENLHIEVLEEREKRDLFNVPRIGEVGANNCFNRPEETLEPK